MEYRFFENSDVKLMNPRDEDKAIWDSFDVVNLVPKLALEGPTFSVFKNNNLVTIIGVRKMCDGVGEIWQLPNKGMIKSHLKDSIKIFRMLEDLMKEYNFHRLYTLCDDDNLHNRWMQYLGYEKEGVMRKHSFDKRDQVIYAKVF